MSYYKQVLTFNFSDDDVRDDFKSFIENKRFEEMRDQSTYALPHKLFTTRIEEEIIVRWSEKWIRNNKIQRGDFVQIFTATAKKEGRNNVASIQLGTLAYNGQKWEI